jgi:O-succinylbenzoic acid--CoA ligase
MTAIPCPISQFAQTQGSRPAVFWGSRRITYLQLNQFINTTVKALKERNLKAGSRVALVVDNSVEAVIVLLSLWRLGAVACPINPKFPDAKIATFLKKVNAAGIVIDRPDVLHGIKIGISKTLISDLIVFDVKDSFYKNDAAPVPMDPGREAAVIFTSGSGGEAKAALLTYGNLYFNAVGSNELIKLAPDDHWLLSLPLYHVSGLGVVFRSLIAGAAVVIVPPENILKVLAEGKATHASLVPTQLLRLLDDKTFAGAQRAMPLRAILLGGSAIPQNAVEGALKRKLPVYVSYGLTEMGSQVATGRPTAPGEICAKVLAHREVKIINGEICVRGATLFKGYVDGERLERSLDAEGWFHTRDLGELDANGCLKVTGRLDNMFISGGENIHPEEIEQVLLKIDSVAQALVVPKEDREFGNRPVAFIQWKKEAHMKTGDALQRFLAAELPKFKIPLAFYPWPQDKDSGLKPDRRKMAELAKSKR